MQIYELFITLATHTSISISYQLKEANRRDKFAPSKTLLRLPHPTIKTQSLLRCMSQQDTHLTRKRGKGAITRLSLRNRTRQTHRPRSPKAPKAEPFYSSLNELYKLPKGPYRRNKSRIHPKVRPVLKTEIEGEAQQEKHQVPKKRRKLYHTCNCFVLEVSNKEPTHGKAIPASKRGRMQESGHPDLDDTCEGSIFP